MGESHDECIVNTGFGLGIVLLGLYSKIFCY